MLLFAAGADTVMLKSVYGVQYLSFCREPRGRLARGPCGTGREWRRRPGHGVPHGGDAVVAWGESTGLSLERIRISPREALRDRALPAGSTGNQT